MTTIRNDGPRNTDVRTNKPTTLKSGAPEGVKKPTVTIAGSDSVGGSAIERSAQNIAAPEVTGQALGQSGTAEDVAKAFEGLAERHLNVALTGNPAGRFVAEGSSKQVDSQAAAAMDQVLVGAEQEHKGDLQQLKADVSAAGARVWIKKSETIESSALTSSLISDPKTKPELQKLTAMMSAMVAMPKSSKNGVPAELDAKQVALAGEATGALLASFSGDVEQLVAVVMMLISKDAGNDVREMLASMKAVTEKRKAKREELAALKEFQGKMDEAFRTQDSVASSAEKNADTAEAAQARAESILSDLQKKTEGKKELIDAAAAARAAANEAVTAANATKSTIEGLAPAFQQPVVDPSNKNYDWKEGRNAWGMPFGGMDMGALVWAYNQGKADKDKITSLDDLMLKLGCVIATTHDKALGNIGKLQTFIDGLMGAGFPATRIDQFTRFKSELNIQSNVIAGTANFGVPQDFSRIYSEFVKGAVDPMAFKGMEDAFKEARDPPHSTEKYKAALEKMIAMINDQKGKSPNATQAAALQNALTLATGLLNGLPKATTLTPGVGTPEQQFCNQYGLSAADGDKLKQAFDALPADARGGATSWTAWAATIPGLTKLTSNQDFTHLNGNRSAISAFFTTTVQNVLSAASKKVTDSQAGLDATSQAANDLASIPGVEASVATAKHAAEEARTNAGEQRGTANDAKTRAESAKRAVDKAQDEMDTLGEMNAENQTKMQMYMDRMQKAQTMLSNLIASIGKTKDGIIQNLK